MTNSMKPANTGPRGSILVVDDEAGMRTALGEVLTRAGWNVDLADSAEAALKRLDSADRFDLLLTDYRMEGMTGLELTRLARSKHPAMPVVMMTAFGTVEDAVTAMKDGVDDYLLKPFSFETAIAVVDEVTGRKQDAPAKAAPRSGEKRPSRGGACMLGNDSAWCDVVRIAEDVADSDATVLLTGESGTGKEVLARHIHEESGRTGAFVAINCAALPESVLESELFGHEKGAFTGAILSRKGRFEMADGGTILLDEVSEIPLSLQAKLLRVLQEREVNPIGGSATIKLDLRVIATSNRDLDQYVEDGHFRQDLYYRLNVISIKLPPLRHRPNDILALADYFLGKYRRPNRPAQSLGKQAVEFLQSQPWRGNVRELENIIERACLLGRNEQIEPSDLHLGAGAMASGSITPISSDPSRGVFDPSKMRSETPTLGEMERRMILDTLDRTGGNRTRTAEMLGVSVRTIRNKLNQYDIKENPAMAK